MVIAAGLRPAPARCQPVSDSDWFNLNAIGKVIRTRKISAKLTTETAYYPLSVPLSAEWFGHIVRAH